MKIRDAAPTEALVLEGLQRRASAIWEAYRAQLAANPAAIELPKRFIETGWVPVAVAADDIPIGFSVVIPADGWRHELDGLFVEPAHMRRGVGRALVEDAAARAAANGVDHLEVTAGPARGSYEKLAFTTFATAETLFGSAVRMRREL